MNNENLKPLNEQPPEKRRAIQSKGGKARAAKARARKSWHERMQELLSMAINSEGIDDFDSIMDAGGKNLTADDAILLKQVVAAINGDLQAAVFVRDTSGNKPKDEIAVSIADSETSAQIEAWFKDNS